MFLQKLNYIHNHPVQAQWKLSETPEEYHYSSSRFYQTGEDTFGYCSTIKEYNMIVDRATNNGANSLNRIYELGQNIKLHK